MLPLRLEDIRFFADLVKELSLIWRRSQGGKIERNEPATTIRTYLEAQLFLRVVPKVRCQVIGLISSSHEYHQFAEGCSQSLIYQLKSIELVAPCPEGSEGTWYRYIIVQGTSEIAGMRPGDHAQVDIAVREMVDRLNERSAGKNAKEDKFGA